MAWYKSDSLLLGETSTFFLCSPRSTPKAWGIPSRSHPQPPAIPSLGHAPGQPGASYLFSQLKPRDRQLALREGVSAIPPHTAGDTQIVSLPSAAPLVSIFLLRVGMLADPKGLGYHPTYGPVWDTVFFFQNFIYLFYFWLFWVFIAAWTFL